MHSQSNRPSKTIYLVTVERTQAANIEVIVDGPDSPEGRDAAITQARARLDAREAVAWAAVGEPDVIGTTAVEAVA